MEKRKLDDIVKKMEQLAAMLRGGQVSPGVFEKLTALCSSMAFGDGQTAMAVQNQLATTDWDKNGQWLTGIKRLIEMASKLGVTL
jgi:hypothetical protein